MQDWMFEVSTELGVSGSDFGLRQTESWLAPIQAIDGPWADPFEFGLREGETANSNTHNLPDVIQTFPRGGSGGSTGGWYWSDDDWGDTSGHSDTTPEPETCEVTNDIGMIMAPDGAAYRVPEGITADYLLGAIAYLLSFSDPASKLVAFLGMYEDNTNPHYIDFKDWGTVRGPPGSISPGSEFYYSEAAGGWINTSATEAFGNYFYGFCGILGGIPPEILGWAAGAVQSGNSIYQRVLGMDDDQDIPHVTKGMQDAIFAASFQKLGLPSPTIFSVIETNCS